MQLLDRSDERRSWHTLRGSSGGDFVRGARIAELGDVDRGHYSLSVELLDARMRTVHGRVWLFDMGDRDTGQTVLIARP